MKLGNFNYVMIGKTSLNGSPEASCELQNHSTSSVYNGPVMMMQIVQPMTTILPSSVINF